MSLTYISFSFQKPLFFQHDASSQTTISELGSRCRSVHDSARKAYARWCLMTANGNFLIESEVEYFLCTWKKFTNLVLLLEDTLNEDARLDFMDKGKMTLKTLAKVYTFVEQAWDCISK